MKAAGPDGRIMVFDESTVAAQKVMPVFDAERGNDGTGGVGEGGREVFGFDLREREERGRGAERGKERYLTAAPDTDGLLVRFHRKRR